MTITSAQRTAMLALLADPDVAAEILKLKDVVRSPGVTYYVNSTTGSNAYEGVSPDRPFATLVYALTQVSANRCDTIYLLPTHAETISGAAYISCATAGVNIIGLGHGSSRPTFTWSATASTWAVSAASVVIKNIRCTCSIDEVVKLFHVTAAHCCIEKVDYFETASCQAIQFLLTDANADYVTVRGCHHYQVTAPTGVSKWVQLVGVDGALVEDNVFLLTLANNAGSVVISGSTACIRAVVRRNTISCTGGTTIASPILFVDSSTGTFVHDNRVAGTAAALAAMIDVGNAGYASQNFAQDTPDSSGILTPVADS